MCDGTVQSDFLGSVPEVPDVGIAVCAIVIKSNIERSTTGLRTRQGDISGRLWFDVHRL